MPKLKNQKKCRVRGYDIAYYREGHGETILFVHGITTYSFIWSDLFHELKSDFEVIALDLLGCGDSDKRIDIDYSIKNQAIIVSEFLNLIGVMKIHIVGHDVGGGLAQIFTVNYPELILSSTFINSVAYDYWPVQPIIAMRTPIIRQLAMASLNLGMFKLIVERGVFNKYKVTDELMEDFFEPMREKSGRKAFLHFVRCLDNHNLIEISDDLKRIKTPVLIVRGDSDVYLSKAISLKLHSDIPNSKLEVISKGGHFLHFDEPLLLLEILKHFLITKDVYAE